jgi:GT2 family glycosyltransferase
VSLRVLTPGERMPLERGASLVCIPVYGAHEFFTRCVASVLEHTPADVPILLADDASPDPASRAWIEDLDERGVLSHEVLYLRQPRNVGFVRNVNTAFEVAPAADVVVLNSDCVVAAEWFTRMREAADSDSLVATVSTLTNHGTIVSVPRRNAPADALPQDVSFGRAAEAVLERSLKLRPRIPTAIGHCMYIRRSALDLVGPFDEALAPAYGEEVDFSQRCVMRGLIHIVADDVFVFHHGSASLGSEGERNPLQDEHEEIIRVRYPFYEVAVDEAHKTLFGRLPRSLAAARRAIGRMSVTIDARCLNPFVTGTQIHTLELTHALWRTQELRLRVVLGPDAGDYALETLDQMPGVERVVATDKTDGDPPRTDLVHRPYQVSSSGDLVLLRRLGERVAVTHQDLISYRNPGYFASGKAWQQFRRLTREALSASDHVLFFSEFAAQDALAEDLLEPYRHSVVHIGVDHRLGSLQPAPARPSGTEGLEGTPYLLCLGTDFLHKNRLFAMKVLAALRERHGWQGRLVLAGPRIRHGSSAGEEAAWQALHPEHATSVLELPAVNEAEKAWLYQHAAAAIYPTTSEGFGLIPFEAADAGVPCLFAQQASLPEVLPDASATLVPWDADASADASIAALTDDAERARMVDEVRASAARLTWDAAAQMVIEAYERMLQAPSREAARMAADNLDAESAREQAENRYWKLWNDIGPTGLSLVGPDGHLPIESQRPLAALARRSATRGPLLAALRAAGRLGRAVTSREDVDSRLTNGNRKPT